MIASMIEKYKARHTELNDNSYKAQLPVSACGKPLRDAPWGESGGSIFRVGEALYFVPTQQTSMDDMLYITCDAQMIEGPIDYSGDKIMSRLMVGAMISSDIEDAILKHLHATKCDKPQGETFAVTRGGKTFRL